jgi:hypothetical protein
MEEHEERVVEQHVVRVVPREECNAEEKISRGEREVSIEIPEGMKLSEEEIKAVVSATQNEIIDIIRDEQAKELAAKPKTRTRVKVKQRDWCSG